MQGADQMKARLEHVKTNFKKALGAALYQEAQVEATESKKRTPVATGNLRASTHVIDPVWEGSKVSVSIVVGGVAAPYAIFVHENLEAFHKVGQAKFLESTLMESREFIGARVAQRIIDKLGEG